ncbi:MAG TPA: CoA-binding protein [Thermoplasmata archaeon]|nr:CoA-binding protein [Thermoplasmata archaeon]
MAEECEIPLMIPAEREIMGALNSCRRIAVVGLSADPAKDSHRVARYLMEHGYEVVPVNPFHEEILGLRSHPDLRSVPVPIDLVDIFRPSSDVPDIVEQAIDIGARVIWMQEGIVQNAAAERATRAGLQVIMNRCIMKEHRRMTSGAVPE